MMEFIDLAAQQERIKAGLDRRIADVLLHGKYILGPEVQELEAELSGFCGAKHTITCANGTDALEIALMALGVGAGDAVFVPSFTFAASAEVVPKQGATPVFVDVEEESFNICMDSLERAVVHAAEIGLQPKAIVAVDLFGLAADHPALEQFAAKNGLFLIDDAAQGLGAKINNRMVGSFGDITTTSFFPAKPLGCYGDGGAIFTNGDDLAELVRSIRMHGKGTNKYDNSRIGVNSRLDTMQAAILLEKLAIFPGEIERREKVARRYTNALSDVVQTPVIPSSQNSTWAQYTLRLASNTQRDALKAYLGENGIPSVIYYPKPLHLQAAFQGSPADPEGLGISEKLSQTVLSLPMHPYLKAADQERVINCVCAFFADK